MQDLPQRIARLRRPDLLARAARFGVDDYCRDRHLSGLLGSARLPRPGPALIQLLQLEEEMNSAREARAGSYRPARHVDLLIAILGEARLLPKAAATAPTPALSRSLAPALAAR